MSAETGGPGRRLTDDEERLGAGMFAAGASTRDVAEALGCSASTAHRLKERLQQPAPAAQDGQQDGQQGAPGGTEMEMTPWREAEGEMERLQAEQARLADLMQVYRDRAQASRQALAALDAERIALLAEGKDAAPLRPRRAAAEADLADSETSEQLAAARLAEVGSRVAQIGACRELDAHREQLAAAVAERDAILARSGERQRAAVLAVRDAAVDFTATLADERAAVQRAGELAAAVAAGAAMLGEPLPDVAPEVSTSLLVDPGHASGRPLALMRAFSEARIGDAEAVAVCLAEAFGWLPPDPAELAAEQERLRRMWESSRQPAPRPAPAMAHPEHWPAAVSMDGHGNPLAPSDPDRPRQQQAVRPGALGFTPPR